MSSSTKKIVAPVGKVNLASIYYHMRAHQRRMERLMYAFVSNQMLVNDSILSERRRGRPDGGVHRPPIRPAPAPAPPPPGLPGRVIQFAKSTEPVVDSSPIIEEVPDSPQSFRTLNVTDPSASAVLDSIEDEVAKVPLSERLSARWQRFLRTRDSGLLGDLIPSLHAAIKVTSVVAPVLNATAKSYASTGSVADALLAAAGSVSGLDLSPVPEQPSGLNVLGFGVNKTDSAYRFSLPGVSATIPRLRGLNRRNWF